MKNKKKVGLYSASRLARQRNSIKGEVEPGCVVILLGLFLVYGGCKGEMPFGVPVPGPRAAHIILGLLMMFYWTAEPLYRRFREMMSPGSTGLREEDITSALFDLNSRNEKGQLKRAISQDIVGASFVLATVRHVKWRITLPENAPVAGLLSCLGANLAAHSLYPAGAYRSSTGGSVTSPTEMMPAFRPAANTCMRLPYGVSTSPRMNRLWSVRCS